MSLARKLALLIVASLMVLTAGSYLALRSLQQTQLQNARNEMRTDADTRTAAVEAELAQVLAVWQAIADEAGPEILDGTSPDLGEISSRAGGVNTTPLYAVVVSTSGEVISSTDDSMEPAPPLVAGGLSQTTWGLIERTGTTAAASVAGPVPDVGSLIIGFDLESILGVAAAPAGRSSEEVLLVARDDEGPVVLNESRLAGTDRFSIRAKESESESLLVTALTALGPTDVATTDHRGVQVLGSAQPVDGPNWGIVAKIDRSEAIATYAQIRRSLAVFLGLFALGLVLLGGNVLRKMRRRMQRIRSVARSLSAGELDETIDDGNSDEIGQLATTIDRLTVELREDRARRNAAEEALAHQVRHDPLTGLPNRAAFMDELDRRLQGEHRVAVLFSDLDGFKAVNDGMGHSAGDVLLTSVAARFTDAAGADDFLARFGGDEFVLLCTVDGPEEAPLELAAELESSLNEPIMVGPVAIDMNASIGISVHEPGDSADLVVRNADIAMYRVKEQRKSAGLRASGAGGNSQYGSFGKDEELRLAIEEGEQLRLLYQPIVHLHTGEIIGVEALIRWHHPSLGLLNPRGFLPRADRSGLLGKLDFWVIGRACAQLEAWARSGRIDETFVMSVNLSPAQLSNPGLLEHIETNLDRYDVDPGMLQIEIIEHSLVTDDIRVMTALNDLKQLGVKLAIDDFGTLHANLDRVKNLPADVLKIDQSFIATIVESANDRAIIEAIVGLTKALELKVVAEGIESVDQAKILASLGCKYGQGFFFGNARSPDATAHLLTHGLPGVTLDLTGDIPAAIPDTEIPQRRKTDLSAGSSRSLDDGHSLDGDAETDQDPVSTAS